jgi:hypothetical protein
VRSVAVVTVGCTKLRFMASCRDPARTVAVAAAIISRALSGFGLAASRSVPHPTRLETRTKESNVHASRRILSKFKGEMKVNYSGTAPCGLCQARSVQSLRLCGAAPACPSPRLRASRRRDRV